METLSSSLRAFVLAYLDLLQSSMLLVMQFAEQLLDLLLVLLGLLEGLLPQLNNTLLEGCYGLISLG